MKNYKYYLSILTLSIFMMGCESNLEEIRPEQSLDNDAVFADENGARGALIGVYGLCQDVEAFGSMPQIIADYQSDNVDFQGSFPTLQEINNYTTLANNGSINTMWRDHYEIISAANAVIANIPEMDVTGFTQEEKDQLVGEALFLRAMVHFNLVNFFAHPFQVSGGSNLGVPLITEPFTGEVILYERSTVNEVHAQIRADLEQAINLLPGDDLAPSRASVGAANTLLSRLHLYREEWSDAAEHANVVVSGPYTPASGIDHYNSGSTEDLFTFLNTSIDNGSTGAGGWDSYYEPAEQGGRGDCVFSTYLINAFDANDERLAYGEVGGNGEYYTFKYNDGANNSSNFPAVRVAEAYLNRAEALANAGGAVTQEIIDLVNMTRTRAGLVAYATSDFANVSELLTAISNERRFEFAFEGHRRMDLLRIGQSLRPAGDPDFDFSQPGDDLTILPIPQGEIDLNPNLVQNDGY